MTNELLERLFSFSDLNGGAKLSEPSIQNIIFARGEKSKFLLQHKIFQQVISDFYLTLIEMEDELPVDASEEAVKDLRLQRRLLRQILANLDNKVAQHERTLEEQSQTLKDEHHDDDNQSEDR